MLANSSEFSGSLIVHFRHAEKLREEAVELLSVDLNVRQLYDLELLLNRGFYPLGGYLGKEDYYTVLEEMRLSDGAVWPIPICLDLSENVAEKVGIGQRIALNDQEGFLLAILSVSEKWRPDKHQEAAAVYGTSDPHVHPGVKNLMQKHGEWYLAGSIEGVTTPIHYDFGDLRLSPSETHRRFTQYGWRRVLGFHVRDYLHCAHREMVLSVARDIGASVFLHPVVGLENPGNRDHYTQVHCYQEFVKHFPSNMILLGLTPMAERFAGPREALWHAIIRKNFGCSHFVVAEDHGDPFSGKESELFYPKGAAQDLVQSSCR